MKLRRVIVASGVNMRRFLLMILLIPIVAVAQDDANAIIVVDEELTLVVADDNRASAIFVVEEADYFTIQVTSESADFDPVVWIVDSQNRLQAYNDQSDNDNIAQIEHILLPADQYMIFIDSFNGVSEGEVTISISTTDPFETNISANESDIVITVTLPEDMTYQYWLDVTTGDQLTITVRDISGTLDPYLTVIDDNETILAVNDDHRSNNLALNLLDSQIPMLDTLDNSMVLIEVHDLLGNWGQFELSIIFRP